MRGTQQEAAFRQNRRRPDYSHAATVNKLIAKNAGDGKASPSRPAMTRFKDRYGDLKLGRFGPGG